MAQARRTSDLNRIGAVIRDRRERRAWVRRDLADRSGLSVDFIKDIELGRWGASRINYLKLADALDMTVEEMDELTGQKVDIA